MTGIDFCKDPYEMATDSDALVLVTEWNEFKQLDMERIRDLMRTPVMVDGRNLYIPQKMTGMGFKYRGIGRGYNGAAKPEAT
jgi:UDPglucose 6-dehydrogenase